MKKLFYDPAYRAEIHHLDLGDGYDMAYIRLGKKGGHPILFVHGLASYIPSFYRNYEELSKTNEVIVVDLPGYGYSSKKLHSGKMSFYAEMLYKFVTKLRLPKIILAGHSMGGHISLYFALTYPEKLHRLILLAPAGVETFTKPEAAIIRESITAEYLANYDIKQIEQSFRINFYKMPTEAWFMIQDRIAVRNEPHFMNYCRVVARSLNGMLDEPIFNRLSELEIKTLLFYGENDRLIPNLFIHSYMTSEQIAMKGRDAIKNCKLILIPKCGHFIQFEKPEEVNYAILKFIES